MSAGREFEDVGSGGGGEDGEQEALSERERRRKEQFRDGEQDDPTTGTTAGRPEPGGEVDQPREDPTTGTTAGRPEPGGEVQADQTAGGDDGVGMDTQGARRDPRSSEERRAANELASQSEFIDREDVVFVERDGQTFATVDPETRQLLGSVGFTGEVPASESSQEFIQEGGRAGETGGGEDLPVASGGGSAEAALVAQATAAVTESLARSRINAAGIVNPQMRQAAMERAEERIDVERGRDFELSITRGPEGISADVRLTEQRQRAEAAGALEKRLFRQTGIALEADEDFTLTETESGGFEPEIAEAGEQKLATRRTTQAVERLATGRGLPVTIPGARGLPGVASDTIIVGKGTEVPIPEGSVAGSDPDVGQTDIPIPGTDTTFEGALGAVTRAASRATDVPAEPATGRPATGPGVPSALPGASDFTLSGTGRELAHGAVETPLKLPTLAPLATVGLAKDVVFDFGGEVAGATVEAAVTGDTRRLKRIPGAVGQTTANVAVGATESFLRDPARSTGAIAASLPVSVGLFKAARAAGPRASLATRGLLQPGEEIAGIGGFAVTRRIAGERRAQQLFPNKEPLIFSEEAAIRGLSRARSRGGDLLKRIELEPRAGFGAGPQPPKIRLKSETETEFDDEMQELLKEAERAATIRRAEGRAEERIMREALERGERARSGMTGERRGARTVDSRVSGKSIEREAIEPAVTESGRLARQRSRMGPRGVQQSAFEARLSTEAATEAELETQFTAEVGRVEVESPGLTAEDVRSRTAADVDQHLRADSEIQGRVTAEGETRTEVDLRTDVRGELRAEGETRAELEAEAELEGEGESEFEVEGSGPPERQRRGRRRSPTDTAEFEKVFASPVATAEEVLSGDGAASALSSDLEGLSEDVLDDS